MYSQVPQKNCSNSLLHSAILANLQEVQPDSILRVDSACLYGSRLPYLPFAIIVIRTWLPISYQILAASDPINPMVRPQQPDFVVLFSEKMKYSTAKKSHFALYFVRSLHFIDFVLIFAGWSWVLRNSESWRKNRHLIHCYLMRKFLPD